MKVRYIGEEAQIGSRATFAFGRTWHIGQWVDVNEGLGDAYWSQFGAKISKNIFFEVDGGDVPRVEAKAADAPAEEPVAPKPRGKKKGA